VEAERGTIYPEHMFCLNRGLRRRSFPKMS
jgi:hypothetical protein